MKTSRQRWFTVLLLMLFISILCLIITGTGSAVAYLLFKSAPPITIVLQVITSTQEAFLEHTQLPPAVSESVPTIAITPKTTPTTQPTLIATPSPLPDQDLPSELIPQMAELESQVAELRGLQPIAPVTRKMLSITELRQHIIDDFHQRYSLQLAERDATLWETLGLLDKGFDLFMYLLQYHNEREASFYDPETKVIYLLQGNFDGPAKMSYVREYFQAIQDQHFDVVKLGLQQERCESYQEQCLPLKALIEGDASNLEMQWFNSYATQQDVAEIEAFLNQYESPMFDRAPAFLQQDFMFPYAYGQAFIEHLYQSGEWEAVNEAYLRPPLSTEQIMHPERYPNDPPISVSLPEISQTLGEGWRELDRGMLGEWYHALILGYGNDPKARIEETLALSAADGWGGDAYVLLVDEENNQVVFVLQTTWDTSEDADEFEQAFRMYSGLRYGMPISDQLILVAWNTSQGYTEFHRDGNTTTWIVAPDAATALLVWNSLEK